MGGEIHRQREFGEGAKAIQALVGLGKVRPLFPAKPGEDLSLGYIESPYFTAMN